MTGAKTFKAKLKISVLLNSECASFLFINFQNSHYFNFLSKFNEPNVILNVSLYIHMI